MIALAPCRKQPRRSRPKAAGFFDELIVDNFAGGGGASIGIERAAGRAVDIAINHDPMAVAMHAANHPHTRHLTEDVFRVDPIEVTAGRAVGVAWFSPDCTHHSRAKGKKPLSKKIRGLAWVVVRWARRVRPRVIFLENVREFQEWGPLTSEDRPCPARKGTTFRLFVNQLRGAGYAVEWRTLNAADYGAPTHRRRLFMIARCDGAPIVWPEPTHGPERSKPWRTAAEIIDWSLPCHSIFLTREEGRAVGVRRPLAENTMRRIANGVKRYVLEAKKPFIVRTGHWSTITGEGTGFRGQGLDKPLGAVCATNDKGLVVPFVAGVGGRAGQSPETGMDRPVGTITAKNDRALVVPHLQQFFGGMVGKPLDVPVPTVTGIDHNGLCSAVLVGTGGAAYAGKPRPVDQPAGSVLPQSRQAVVEAFLAKTDWQAKPKSRTVTLPEIPPEEMERINDEYAEKVRGSISAAFLSHFNHGAKQESDVREPLRTVTAQGFHHAEVRAFLTKYYGQGCGQAADEPLHTVVSKDRFGVVMVEGEPFAIVDIGLRMLCPRELARAQGFPDSYVLTGNNREQVARIGNSVSPVMSEALVRANLGAAVPQAAGVGA